MGIKKKLIQLVRICIVCMFVTLTQGSPVFAASGILGVSSQTGEYQTGQVFDIRVTLDGGGTPLNAAKASVIISQSLRVQSVTLGDCGFAFVLTPTQTDPSFAGVILGGSTTSCTVYTLTLQAIQPGVGSITFINGSIKSYKGASETLSLSKNGVYTLNGSSSSNSTISLAPTIPPTTTSQGIKLYTLVTNITLPSNVPASSVKILLDPNMPGQRVVAGSEAVLGYPIVFDRVPQGVHTLEVISGTQPISKQIVAIGGTNGTLVFGVSQKKSAPTLWYLILILCILLISIGGFIVYKRFSVHKPAPSTHEST